MPLTPGLRIGPYEVLGLLGAGGMGEVYRARDHKLNRDVALKILADDVAADPDRVARFRREAQVLASLNHANIAAIYGFEDAPSSGPAGGATHALVLELVEGPTLADRLAAGPIPVAEALPIARQIADALASAHELNIIHRDLKPANIKVRADGTVKVLDFGLAKAIEPEAGATSSTAMNSPTLTARATQLGVILGTAAYMAPEQARGKPVDRRADLWAFGVVLYEMLTGRRAFDGPEISDVLASVLKETPPMDALPGDVPASVRRLLRRTLEKDRARRLDSMAAARLELDEVDGRDGDGARRGDAPAAPAGPQSRRLALPILASVVITGLLIGAIVWQVREPARPAVVRLGITAAADRPFAIEVNHNDIAIAPDGGRIVYFTRVANEGAFVVRPLDRFETTLVSKLGSDPRGVSVSADGAWIGFQTGAPIGAGAQLRKVSIDGGASLPITDIDGNLRGTSWGADETILFATAARTTGIQRVAAAGGQPEVLTAPGAADGEADHLWPHYLPGGRHALFSILRTDDTWDVAVLALDTKTWRVLFKDGKSPRYVSTGHVVYAAAGGIRAVPFDLKSLQVTGDSVEVQAGVISKDSGAADFAVSSNGTLVYLPGVSRSGSLSLAWVARDGKETPLRLPPADYSGVRVSPDGKLAVAVVVPSGSQTGNLWLIDLERETSIRLTPADLPARAPVWKRDSREIVFSAGPRADPQAAGGLFRIAVTGAAVPERLTTADAGTVHAPGAWTLDGRQIIFTGGLTRGATDIMLLTLGTPPAVTTLVGGPAPEVSPALSPDGRWLAYAQVDPSSDVFVRPFPNVNDARIPVSVGGGGQPVWSADGRELYFRPDQTHVNVVPVEKTQPLTFGKVKPFLERKAGTNDPFVHALPPVNGRVLAVVAAAAALDVPVDYRVVLHWTDELAARVKARR